MISVKQAHELLFKNSIKLSSDIISLSNSLGRVLAEDIFAPVAHPIFDQTAVDGYAIRFDDAGVKKSLLVEGEIQAGAFTHQILNKGTAYRVFTGAPIPEGADTVVMQEKVEVNDNNIKILDKSLIKGRNIRKRGEQVIQGGLALKKGTVLKPANIGFLASLGITTVKVSRTPKVGVIVTGNEFVTPNFFTLNLSEDPEPGKIFESNGVMLRSCLLQAGIKINHWYTVSDNKEKLKNKINELIDSNDIIIITGGVSVGKYDFTRPALEELGFDITFHKVAQKPGKPILLAQKNEKSIFGLPGNPRAVWVCYYMYVLPYLKYINGNAHLFPGKIKLPLNHIHEKNDKRTHFLAGKIVDEGIQILQGQDSHLLKSLSDAEVLVELPEDTTKTNKGDLVSSYLLNS